MDKPKPFGFTPPSPIKFCGIPVVDARSLQRPTLLKPEKPK